MCASFQKAFHYCSTYFLIAAQCARNKALKWSSNDIVRLLYRNIYTVFMLSFHMCGKSQLASVKRGLDADLLNEDQCALLYSHSQTRLAHSSIYTAFVTT